MPTLAAVLVDGPLALYLAWVAFTLALVVTGVVWLIRPALAATPLKRLGVGWLVMTFVVIFVSFHVFGRQTPADPSTPLAPNFTLHTVSGQTFSRGSLHGKVVLLEFWASWCGPCRESLPEMFRLHQEFRNNPRFVMIGVNEDEHQSKFEDFVAQKAIPWAQDWDPTGQVLGLFSSDALPSYAVIGPDGRLRFFQKGYNGETLRLLHEAISDALGRHIASTNP